MLDRSQQVVVRLPELGALPATVEADDDQVLTVAFRVTPDRPLSVFRDQEATVELTTGRGLKRLVGLVGAEPGHPEVLHLRRTGEEAVVQRRDAVRVQAVLSVAVSAPGGGDAAFETTTLNISGCGLLLRDPVGLEVGTSIAIDIVPEPGAEPIQVVGTVVRAADEDLKGVCFEHLSDDAERRLVRLVTDRERQALRMTRDR